MCIRDSYRHMPEITLIKRMQIYVIINFSNTNLTNNYLYTPANNLAKHLESSGSTYKHTQLDSNITIKNSTDLVTKITDILTYTIILTCFFRH